MNNQSFTCNGIPEFPLNGADWYLTGAGGLLEGNIPVICGSWKLFSRCFPLKNRQWRYVIGLKTKRIEIGSGK